MTINLVGQYALYQIIPTEDDPDVHVARRGPFTYTTFDEGHEALENYAKAWPDTIFFLIEEVAKIISGALKVDANGDYWTHDDVIGTSVDGWFHNHDEEDE